MDEDTDMKEKEDNFSNSAEDSSSDDDADEEKITELKDQIASHPYSYELQVQLISLCRKLGDLEQLRSARENMSKMFPLSPELWLDWLSDEKTLASTPEQKEELTDLFERAVKDYASVAVWLEYVQFSIGKIGEGWDENGLSSIRRTFERAVTAVGTHVSQGCLVWEAYREFETAYLLHLKSKDATEEEVKEQEDKIYNIFKRQLSIPLFDMDKTYIEFKEVFKEKNYPDIKTLDYSYNKAMKKLEELQTYENALYTSDSPHYEEFKAYIRYEKKTGDPSRIQNLYERALIENCLKEDLWLNYTKFLDQVIKIGDISISVYERAVRNLPWSVKLWVQYGRALEKYEKPYETIKEMFETVVMSGFVEADDFKDLWLAYLDYLRRRIKIEDVEAGDADFHHIEDVFNRALMQMNQYFYGSEAEYIIMKYWVFFNGKYKKDMDTARQSWKEVIDHGHREEGRVWLEYANFEKLYGDSAHYRKCLLQAISYVNEWPETFIDMLISFERQEGTLESLEKSLAKCETLMQTIKEKQQKKLEQEMIEKENYRRKRSGRRQEWPSRQESPTKSESQHPVQMDSEGFKIPFPPTKLHSPDANSRTESPMYDESKRNRSFLNEDSRRNRGPPREESKRNRESSNEESRRSKRPPSEEQKSEPKRRKVETTSESHGVIIAHDSSKDDRTVFVSNLSYKVEEEQIKEFFSRIGELEEVRLVKDFKGRSKGFCYVFYKTEADAKIALSKDRELLDGRPVFISNCQDKKTNPSFQPKFKFGTGLERKKLFIKNLPFEITKEDLEKMYKEYGILKDVRIVTYRNGHSKGLAYVEFEDEASAANAVVKTDGNKIQEHVISVAISNPPPRKQKEFSATSIADSLGGGGRAAKGPRGRGRTQLAMVPRSIARQTSNTKDSSSSNNSIENGQNKSSDETKPLSNSDFAKMLMK